jgi:hypothetical protein
MKDLRGGQRGLRGGRWWVVVLYKEEERREKSRNS